MSKKTQNFQYKANAYLKELIETLKREFPKIAEDEQKIIDAVKCIYNPAYSDFMQTK